MFGEKLPKGLRNQIAALYPHMTDGALKQYVLTRETWDSIDQALQAEIIRERREAVADRAMPFA